MLNFKVVDQHNIELKGCIIVLSEHGGYDIYETEEDLKNGIDIIDKSQRYCSLVMVYN